MVKIAVAGIGGRMGGLIARLAVEDAEIELTGATELSGHRLVGESLASILNIKELQGVVSDNPEDALKQADVYVDFTSPSATIKALEVCYQLKKSAVVGTTGLNEEQEGKIREFAQNIAIVFSPNMSLGVNLLATLVEKTASVLGADYDIEVVEAHHRMKADAPSGTAILLAKSAAKGRGWELEKCAVYGREGRPGARPAEQIGIMAVRGGDIVGEHTVFFAGNGERIELIHRAHSRDTFARGALRAVKWVAHKSPGLYSMMDVLGVKG